MYTCAFTSVMEVQCTRLKPPWSFSVCWKSTRPVNAPSWFLSCSSIKKLFKCEECLLPWKDTPPHPGFLSSPATFIACWRLPALSAQISSCSCHSFCVLGPTFIPVDHSTASLLLEMALDYSHKRQEVRGVKYRPRCLWQQCSLLNKDVWAGVTAQLVKFVTSGLRTGVL